MGKPDIRHFLNYLKDHLLVLLIVAVLGFGFLWILVDRLVSPRREEQLNFAITAFAHHDEGKKDSLEKILAPYGIKEVNLSYFDVSDTARAAEYLLTYGYHMADVFILDTGMAESVLKDCFYSFSEEQIKQLGEAAGFEPGFVTHDGSVVGVLVHQKGNDAYNLNFPVMNEWLLFAAEGQEHDFAVFLNADSIHSESAGINLLELFLQRRNI